MTQEQIVLSVAESLRDANASHTDAHNAIFGPKGVATKMFTNEKQRKAFSETKESKKTRAILSDMLEAENRQSSGKIAVRIPVSLHDALKRESEREDTSLNQLILAKLAVSLKEHCA